jgi:hypothetical protein
MTLPNPYLDTAAQRKPTGRMDKNVRALILSTMQGASNTAILGDWWRDEFTDVNDYLNHVADVWEPEAAAAIVSEVTAVGSLPSAMAASDVRRHDEAIAEAILVAMPEADFRSAVFKARIRFAMPAEAEDRIAAICKSRGIPWTFTIENGFQWVGDSEVEHHALVPALSAIADPRLAGATRSEFDGARVQLAVGTPAALKLAVIEAGSAVESAMKVLLTAHGDTYEPADAAAKLFGRLKDAGHVEPSMERIILGTSMVRNKKAGHGAGEVPHDVPLEMAEAAIASAAVAIAFLHSRLP